MNRPDWLYDPPCPDPFYEAAPFLDREPRTLVIVGLGDVDELTPALKRWPNVRAIGVDPDPRAIEWQDRFAVWPEGSLVQKALDSASARVTLWKGDICHSTIQFASRSLGAVPVEVEATTLDALDEELGLEGDVVLWVDVEDAEARVLAGGPRLLASGRVALVNVEVRYVAEEAGRQANWFLASAGYRRVRVWFRQWWGHNEVWVPEGRLASWPR